MIWNFLAKTEHGESSSVKTVASFHQPSPCAVTHSIFSVAPASSDDDVCAASPTEKSVWDLMSQISTVGSVGMHLYVGCTKTPQFTWKAHDPYKMHFTGKAVCNSTLSSRDLSNPSQVQVPRSQPRSSLLCRSTYISLFCINATIGNDLFLFIYTLPYSNHRYLNNTNFIQTWH